jgi:hypothetical protein
LRESAQGANGIRQIASKDSKLVTVGKDLNRSITIN